MAEKAAIGPSSKVLDLGCGNGLTATWLSRSHGCQVVGIDLSGIRIRNAREALARQPKEVTQRLRFKRASATSLPFEDETFTHVWSQATIYHIHDKEKALSEAYRVLAKGGTFVFDDLLKPNPNISDMARTYVYERLLFDTDFSLGSYQQALEATGFAVLESHDLSQHLKQSYEYLAGITREKSGEHQEKYRSLSFAYGQMIRAVERGELGWGMYVCRK